MMVGLFSLPSGKGIVPGTMWPCAKFPAEKKTASFLRYNRYAAAADIRGTCGLIIGLLLGYIFRSTAKEGWM